MHEATRTRMHGIAVEMEHEAHAARTCPFQTCVTRTSWLGGAIPGFSDSLCHSFYKLIGESIEVPMLANPTVESKTAKDVQSHKSGHRDKPNKEEEANK